MHPEVEAIPGAAPDENPTPARLDRFSDGVFAIIITLHHDAPGRSAGCSSTPCPAFLLASVDTRVSMLTYVLLLLYYSMPGPAVVRWMTGRRAAAAGRPLQGARSC